MLFFLFPVICDCSFLFPVICDGHPPIPPQLMPTVTLPANSPHNCRPGRFSRLRSVLKGGGILPINRRYTLVHNTHACGGLAKAWWQVMTQAPWLWLWLNSVSSLIHTVNFWGALDTDICSSLIHTDFFTAFVAGFCMIDGKLLKITKISLDLNRKIINFGPLGLGLGPCKNLKI